MARARMLDTDFPPDAFAVVMATGIVSVAADDHGYRYISRGLGAVATVAFVLLAGALAVKLLARYGSMVAELRDPDAALRMFTFVAGAAVLGVVWRPLLPAVWVVGAFATVGWLLLVPLAVRDVRSRPRVELRDHARGAWLLISVATSGMATTAADLGMDAAIAPLVVVAAALWLVAIVLYALVTALIIWRAVAEPLHPTIFTPDSWILMGALAIATLSGAHLLDAARVTGVASWLVTAAGPATITVWVMSSLWIPFLLYAEMWRVDQQPGSLRFSGVWWSAVFPLGMYASASAATASSLGWPRLQTVSLVAFWVAFTVWTMVAVGLARAAFVRRRAVMPTRRREPGPERR